MARGNTVVTASLTAQATFTDHLQIRELETNLINLSISGLTDSTVTVQRSFDDGATWLDVVQYTSSDAVNTSVQKVIEGGFERYEMYRVGIKTGDYGTDTVVCRLSH